MFLTSGGIFLCFFPFLFSVIHLSIFNSQIRSPLPFFAAIFFITSLYYVLSPFSAPSRPPSHDLIPLFVILFYVPTKQASFGFYTCVMLFTSGNRNSRKALPRWTRNRNRSGNMVGGEETGKGLMFSFTNYIFLVYV